MPRTLTIQRSVVPVADRPRYLERLRARQAHYAAQACRFWVFEEVALPGAFVEFTEAADAATLASAHAGAPDPPVDPARVYREVELG